MFSQIVCSSLACTHTTGTGKQCRERWHNQLDPNIKKEGWSEEEDRVLLQSHLELGNHWVEISKVHTHSHIHTLPLLQGQNRAGQADCLIETRKVKWLSTLLSYPARVRINLYKTGIHIYMINLLHMNDKIDTSKTKDHEYRIRLCIARHVFKLTPCIGRSCLARTNSTRTRAFSRNRK